MTDADPAQRAANLLYELAAALYDVQRGGWGDPTTLYDRYAERCVTAARALTISEDGAPAAGIV